MAWMQVGFFSEVLGLSSHMNVFIPQETSGQIGMKGKASESYKTLYLLHGMSDDDTIWQRRTSIERYASERGLAVVMPAVALSFYTDMEHGGKYYTYVSQELPKICRSFFKGMSDKREDNFVAGLSMGGYGAMKLALLKSDCFAAGASFSGAVDIVTHVSEAVKQASGTAGLFTDIFGTPEKLAGSDNDLMAAAERLAASGKKKPRLYMWCGTEDFLVDDNRRFKKHLEKLGYDLTYSESSGDHQWKYWDWQIEKALDWMLGTEL